MTIQSYARENQINEIATMIRDTGNTTVINVYAIQDKNTGCIVNYKNNMFYITRKTARKIRLELLKNGSYLPKDVKIVQTQFVNMSPWKTAR